MILRITYKRCTRRWLEFQVKETQKMILSAPQLNRMCFSTPAASENTRPLSFSEQETSRILNIINTKTEEQLANYDIAKTRLHKIEAWRQKNGDFQNLDDVLHLDGFSVKVVERFFRSLLGEAPKKRLTRKAPSFVTPLLPESYAADINSSVSINVGVSSIIWSRLQLHRDGPCELTHWERHEIQGQKLHLHDLIHRCLYADYQIPEADCYLFENPQIAQSAAPGNAEQVNINVQRAQMTAMLGFALAKRNKSEDRSKTNIFYLRRFLAARLFQNLIGSERVSAEKAILNLMRTYYNIDDLADTEQEQEDKFSSRGNVTFPTDLRTMYKQAEPYHREFLGQTLLLNLAFVRLVLLRDPNSINQVSRTPKSNEVE